jgi:SHS family lactate transporter-like MFS transporter
LSLPFLPLYVGASRPLLSLGAFATGALGVGFCGTVPLLLTNLFEARLRARFVGLAYHVGAFFAAYVPLAIAGLARACRTSLATSLAIVAAVCELALVVLVVARLASPAPKETPA